MFVNNEKLDRRSFLKTGVKAGLVGAAGLAGVAGVSHPVQAATLALPDAGSFKISFRNQHTGETFSGPYRVGSRYLPEAFDDINQVLRDFRTGDVFPIDPRAIDILYMTRRRAGNDNATLEVLSGYRSPQTNAMLARSTGGVATNSLHMTGQAIDIRLAGCSTSHLYEAARSLRAGGVGYYPSSGFVHVDTGRVRHW